MKKMILIMLISLGLFAQTMDEMVEIKTADTLARVIAGKEMKIKYYFFVKDSKAFLSSKADDNTYRVWHFTADRKWLPLHNANAYDGFDKAEKVFTDVKLNINANDDTISFSKLVGNNQANNDLLKILENNTIKIRWYFWSENKTNFLLTRDGESGIRVWNFTNKRKWRPIHNAPVYDGYPKAGKRLGNARFDRKKGRVNAGFPLPDYDKSSNDYMKDDNHSAEGKASNIPYLKENHKSYINNHDTLYPKPVKDKVAKTIKWSIDGRTIENATKLQEHINFMDKQLKDDKNPRAFDSLFLMEAYMKYNKKYNTLITRNDTNVIITKTVSSACAYEVISAHSDVVSGDFFAKGEIMNDHSATADKILASSDCNEERESITKYILDRKMYRGGKGQGKKGNHK